jgi:hypothetical protein
MFEVWFLGRYMYLYSSVRKGGKPTIRANVPMLDQSTLILWVSYGNATPEVKMDALLVFGVDMWL